jgi:DNA polymerase V
MNRVKGKSREKGEGGFVLFACRCTTSLLRLFVYCSNLVPQMNKFFALVDCNNFYASCERVFNPKLEGKPVVVLSNNDGCVIARSEEAKQIGIKMGQPAFQSEHLFKKHGVLVFSSNYSLYGDMSDRVMETLEQFTSDIEVYSIDEAFLALPYSGSDAMTDHARQIRQTVKKWTGIPVSIGIGPTKTLAKIASKIGKKNPLMKGVFNIAEHERMEEILGKFPVGDIWGVGPRYEVFLKRHGINTALQLRNAHDAWVKKHMTVMGLRTVMELRGTPCFSLEEMPVPKKGIVSSRSFGKPVESIDELKEALATYASCAAEKLRSQHSAASILHVFLMTNRFKKNEPQYYSSSTTILPIASSYTPELIRFSHEQLEKIYKPGYRYKKIGVFLAEIVSQDRIQLNLLSLDYPHERNRILMQVVDKINQRLGPDSVRFAAEGMKQEWHMRRRLLSPRYTTQWSEIPVVKTT